MPFLKRNNNVVIDPYSCWAYGKPLTLKRTFILLSSILVFFTLGCQHTPSAPIKKINNNPLINQIVQAKSRQPISQQALLNHMLKADVIYLGEKHDNPRHHEIQLALLKKMITAGKQPLVGFEFFDITQTGYIRNYLLSPFKTTEQQQWAEKRLRQQLNWDDRSDQEWQYYFQLLHLAKKHQLTVFGADLPGGIISHITRQGQEKLSPMELGLIKTKKTLDENYQQWMYAELTKAHCGWSEPQLLKRLYESWTQRNQTMATSISKMLTKNPLTPIVMIIGKGHIAHDKGVYEIVAQNNPKIKQLNFATVEVNLEPSSIESYFYQPEVANAHYPPPHQIIWLTERVDYNDPCDAFKNSKP